MIRYEQGDMFATPAEIRVNTVNCVGIMGAGLARAFKDRYPAMFKEYAKACKAGEVRPGKPHVWEKREFDETVTVVNLPTKDHWREPSEYEFIEKDLRWLREFLAKRGKARIVLPALGCGHGGLDWDRVRPMMEQALDGLEAEILIFGPSASHEAGQRVDEKAIAELESHGILRLRPGDPRYPARLRGKSDATVYVKGDPGVLNGPLVAVLPSVKPTDREIQGLVACAKEIARPEIALLSGYSPHADRAVVRVALEQGARVVICLVEGILEFRVRKDLQDVWDEERVTVISVAKPTEKWFAGGIGKATAIKLALSKTALVSDPDPEWLRTFVRNGVGGLRTRLFYLHYGGLRDDIAGLLRQMQAKAIGRNRQDGKPCVAELLDSVAEASATVETQQPSAVAEERDKYEVGAAVEPMKVEAGMAYPKRLIEVDLPIRRISAHARAEKEMRRGHVPMMHIWWACRPPSACRAVICAALWPDPADKLCPAQFVTVAAELMHFWASAHLGLCSPESFALFNKIAQNRNILGDHLELRRALLEFIADFAAFGNSTRREYVTMARYLTIAAHGALEGSPPLDMPMPLSLAEFESVARSWSKPFLFDPFSGGGAIPLEGARCGADVFASDLNPVAVLLEDVCLRLLPQWGDRLLIAVRDSAVAVSEGARRDLAAYYPADSDGASPVAYLWARTVCCDGPGCGVEFPLIRSTRLVRKKGRGFLLQLTPCKGKRVGVAVVNEAAGGREQQGTMRSGSATCPVCGFTMPNKRVRAQLAEKRGGADDAQLLAVVTTRTGQQGRYYRKATDADLDVVRRARRDLGAASGGRQSLAAFVPDETIPSERPSPNARGLSAVTRIGVTCFGDLFTARQKLALVTYCNRIREAHRSLVGREGKEFADAVTSVLSLVFDKMVDMNSAFCVWQQHAEIPAHLFARQAVPIVWDFAEANPIAGASGSLESALKRTLDVMPMLSAPRFGDVTVARENACAHPLPDDSVHAFVTDPPYYDAIPYADLSDFFYVWLRRLLGDVRPELFEARLTPKDEEAIWNPSRTYGVTGTAKDEAFYERQMTRALSEGRRVTVPSGIGTVVFAHKSTAGWEAVLGALVKAGWTVTASWPIDTEMASRVNAKGTASLASSVHLVCRPREEAGGAVRESVGDWRTVTSELPGRIQAWLPRLAAEGVVGADAIFSCLGPALEIFSRYSVVEKTSGEKVELREYLEQVWAEVARQALNMIFEGADASGLEEDARLTAMWLWTLRTDAGGSDGETDEEHDGDDDEPKATKPLSGYALEYDAARKIAQGLGCHLENLTNLVEVAGETATLLSAGARARHLFGREDVDVPKKRGKKKGDDQGDLFAALALPSDEELEREKAELDRPPAGNTVLDRLHQSMILFGVGRGQALKRFLVDDGIGANPQFWKLAQALSALYPPQSDEKRWVDGVLARKKGLGF
ncbi:MAG: macro domain-containing protein [Candidatus Hydrogenedentes bacterium]|nr:macro domain-containing protein [Candidatus Hydrogenedentota bacterium]